MTKIIINNKAVSLKKIKELTEDIKNKKELKNVNSEFVNGEIVRYLRHNRKAVDTLIIHKRLERSREYKKIIKHVRSILRRIYGVFQFEDVEKRKELLKKLKKDKSLDLHEEILKTHSSTRERIGIYPELYKKIFKITRKPRRVLDLGCGLNPFSYPYMKLKHVDYIASDLNKEDCGFIKKYFKIIGIKGKVRMVDLLKKEQVNKLPRSDVCFLFKVLETVELTKSHKISEEIIKEIPAKWIVVSFPTKTIDGKQMKYPRRGWIERMLKRIGYEFKRIIEENEIFYVIKKKNLKGT